jgi:hypothetical protein
MAGFAIDGSFVPKTLAEILDDIAAAQRANIDAALDTSQYGVVGQLNGIVGNALAELWQLAEALHDALDPDKAVGAQQDGLYALSGTLRRAASRSTVVASVKLGGGASIAAGLAQASVLTNPAAKFVNADPMLNAGGSDAFVSVRFAALDTGPVLANAGTLTVIDTPQAGWLEITNVLDAEPGAVLETNSLFRRRRVIELAAQGGGTVPGLRADLLRMPSVRAALVIENQTMEAVDGMPPKSLEAIVQSVSGTGGSDDAAIAALIWANKPVGIQPFGSDGPHEVLDSEGVVHPVYFSRPLDVPIYVVLRLLTDPLRYQGAELAKTAIVEAAEDPDEVGYLDVGADVYAGRIVAAAMALSGVINAEARLSFVAFAEFDDGTTSLAISPREIAQVDTGRIVITGFPP